MTEVERIRAAADRTIGAGSAAVQLESSADGDLLARMHGEVDFAGQRSRIVMDLLQPADGESLEIEGIVDGDDLYLTAIDVPGRWVLLPLYDEETSPQSTDLGLLLDWLRGCREATPVDDGATSVDDGATADVEVFDVVLDLDRAVEAAPDGSRRAVRAFVDQFGASGGAQPARVWVDGAGLVHRVRVPAPDATMDVRFSDHGAPVTIEVPDPSLVLDPDELPRGDA
jgi:hypothetical protein